MKAFVFPGQGAQFVGMGKDLYEQNEKAAKRKQKETENMDKQDEALKLWKDIRTINKQIEQLQELIDSVYTSLTNATVKPKEINVQTSLPADPMADKVAEIVEYQKTLEDYQLSLVEKQMMAIKIIQQMNVEYQHLLHRDNSYLHC